jgi:glycosyltransferase involved in cell wall biosynthesis
MAKLKILSLLWGFSLGGIAKYATSLHEINELEGIDLEIETACIFASVWGEDLDSLLEINAYLIPIDGRMDFSWISKASKLIDTLQPDLLLVHGFNGPVIAQICKLRSRHPFRFVCTYHGLYSAPKRSRRVMVPIFNFVQEFLYKTTSTSILSVSEYSRRYLIKKGVPPEKVTTIHNGIDIDAVLGDRCALRCGLGFNETDFVIGCASRLDPVKGLNYLIDAMPIIIDSVPQAKLVIFGNGVSEKKLLDQCYRLKISKAVSFAGYRSNVPCLMNALDLFVLPSLAEFHSIGILEAMRAGLPIIATDVGGNPESIINGISGILIPPRDITSIATAVIDCAENQDLRERIGSEARRRFVTEFTYDKHLRSTANWLITCTGLKR